MTEKEKQQIGALITKLRKQANNMSQKELAKRTGLNKDTINRLEAGKHQMLPETAQKLAPILKTTAAKLLGL